MPKLGHSGRAAATDQQLERGFGCFEALGGFSMLTKRLVAFAFRVWSLTIESMGGGIPPRACCSSTLGI